MSTNGDAVSLAGSNSDEPPPANEFHGESVEKADEGEAEITDRQSTPLLEAAERYQVEQTASNEEAAEVQSPGEPTEENWSDKVHQLREELAVARSSERTLRTELEYITDLVRRTLQDGEQQAERCLCDHLKLQCRNLVMRVEAGRHDISRASMSPEQLVHLSMRTLELDEMLNQHRMYLEHQPVSACFLLSFRNQNVSVSKRACLCRCARCPGLSRAPRSVDLCREPADLRAAPAD